MSLKPDFTHCGQLLKERLQEADVTVQEAAGELRMLQEDLLALFGRVDVDSILMAKVLGAIEIVRLQKTKARR